MNILLVAEESAGIRILKSLARGRQRVAAVVASPDKQPLGGAGVWQVARLMGFPTWPAACVKDADFAAEMRAAEIDLLLNVHSLHVVNTAVLAAPRLGAYNLHPGPLPRYAGLNAVSWALYRGEQAHGVTLHRMEPEIDTGPIVYQTQFAVADDDTALTVYGKCVRAGVTLLERLLAAAEQGADAIPHTPQDLTQREYFGRRPPQQGGVIWSRPAREVINLVRACDYFPFRSPWGLPRALLDGRIIEIGKAELTGRRCIAAPGTVGATHGGGVEIACGDEWIVCRRVMFGGEACDAAAVLRAGMRLSDGCRLESRSARSRQ